MKKFLSILVIAGSLTACGGGSGDAAKAVDSTVSAAADSVKAGVDSVAAKADSTIKATVDTAKAKVGAAIDSAKKAVK